MIHGELSSIAFSLTVAERSFISLDVCRKEMVIRTNVNCLVGRKTSDDCVCNGQQAALLEYSDKLDASNRLMVLTRWAGFHTKRLVTKKLSGSGSKSNASPQESPTGTGKVLNLSPGEWVEVLSEDEIRSTLDENGRHKGLYFMHEMWKFCGQRFMVKKKVEKILLEANGEMRTLRNPTVILENSFCDGEASGGCERSCYHMWREIWLKRISPD